MLILKNEIYRGVLDILYILLLFHNNQHFGLLAIFLAIHHVLCFRDWIQKTQTEIVCKFEVSAWMARTFMSL